MKDKKVKFNNGDEVFILSSDTKGIVKELTSYLGENDNVYLVSINGKDKMCVESNLQLCRKNAVDISIDITDMAINFKIEDKIQAIIDKLNLKETDVENEKLLNACRLQAYLATTNEYEETSFTIGDSVTKNELYHGLINGDMDSIINSYIFSEILKRINMDVLNVALKNENGQYYVANLVLIDGEYYYFDVTLEMAVFADNGSKINDFVLCCGALGKTSYEQFFTPLCIIDFNDNLGESLLPNNIAFTDIDIDLVNKLLTMGVSNNE
ncbi:MAG TPA: hypothetical protein DCE23_10140 [Firmicutes bacterium]|nr:hypothetical protein [Bacillota bacterium]